MRDLRDDIRDAFEHDHAATTVALARRWLEDDPQDWQVWGWYGTMLYQMARYDEAVAALEKKIEHIPPQGLVYAYCRMGHLYRYRGDYPQAETWYQKAIDYDPTDATELIHHLLTLNRVQCRHNTIARRRQRMFHFHRFQYDQLLSGKHIRQCVARVGVIDDHVTAEDQLR